MATRAPSEQIKILNKNEKKITSKEMVCRAAVCDETQNLNETESETFFRYQIFSIPNPILFPIPIFFRYRYRNFSKPIPILFSIPIFFETNTDTFFETKNFRHRYRYHPNNWNSFKTEKFRNRNVTL